MTTTTTASSMFSAYASFAGSMMLVRSMANQLIPDPIRSYLYSKLNYLFTPLSSNLTMIIDELSGAARNQVYDAAEVYLKTIAISPSTERLRVKNKPAKEHHHRHAQRRATLRHLPQCQADMALQVHRSHEWRQWRR
ncbi:AAA-ATPase [Prunus yedoensis var. nudiflora]|uniref:AAA-ATPase n=1 Tax=Prunus yedoensis var. nudiflora TaxID=2094558 RepID=A0A314ZDC9_PRUYE|nr:AAA-ATPase [Prunus yedoensis var. nudiflora]